MFATAEFEAGETVVSESPVVIGCARAGCCPGCARAGLEPGQHSACCVWHTVDQRPQLRGAREWHHHLCGKVSSVPAEQRSNHCRVICLLAICVQAQEGTASCLAEQSIAWHDIA